MHELAEHEGELYLKESKALRDSREAGPSPEALEKFSKRLDAELKKQRAKTRQLYFPKAMNVAAVAMLAVIIVFFAAMTTVQAFRTRVMNLWLDVRPEYTSFRLRGSTDANDSSIVVNWTNAYVPTYIPEGFIVSTWSYSKAYKRITFENSQDRTSFTLYLELDESDNPVIDTEDASRFEPILINGKDGMLVVKNDVVTIVWEMDSLLFVLQARTSVDMAIRIAEGVRYIK
jgi:hypothetical protein